MIFWICWPRIFCGLNKDPEVEGSSEGGSCPGCLLLLAVADVSPCVKGGPACSALGDSHSLFLRALPQQISLWSRTIHVRLGKGVHTLFLQGTTHFEFLSMPNHLLMSSSLQKDKEACSHVGCFRLSGLRKTFMFMSLNTSRAPAWSLLSVLYTKALQLKFVCIQENNCSSGDCLVTVLRATQIHIASPFHIDVLILKCWWILLTNNTLCPRSLTCPLYNAQQWSVWSCYLHGTNTCPPFFPPKRWGGGARLALSPNVGIIGIFHLTRSQST